MNESQSLIFSTFNARSIKNKTIKINELIKELHVNLIALTETWLSDNDNNTVVINEILPCNMNYYGKNRIGRGGGVGICLQNDIFEKVNVYNDDCKQSFEHLSIGLKKSTFDCIVIVIYRKFDNVNFIEEFESLLSDLYQKNSNLIILGDFNLHLNTNNKIVSNFNRLLVEFNLKIINDLNIPTHNKGNTLDLVICSQPFSSKISKFIVHNDFSISDHFPISFNIDFIVSTYNKKLITYNDFSKIDYEATAVNLQEILYSADFLNMSTEQLCLNYNDTLKQFERSIPKKSFYVRTDKENPWYNKEVNALRKERRRKERRYKIYKTPETKQELKESRNKLIYEIRKSKSSYLIGNVQKANYDTKKLYNLINPLIKKNNTESDFEAHEHAEYFKNKIETINNEIITKKLILTVNPLMINSFIHEKKFEAFELVSEKKVMSLICNLKNKTNQLDPIITKFIKNCNIAKVIAPYLSLFMNRSLQEGVFPNSEKIGIVTPVLKPKKSKDEISSYRPITSLTFISKLLETEVHNQLMSFINKNKLLPSLQSAYKQGHSTTTALIKIHNDIINTLAKGDNIIYMTLDITAAFDTVLHEQLIECLNKFGFINTPLEWFKSYLNNRFTKIKAKNVCSEKTKLDIGIPQGGVLSPTLYSIYISDICYLLESHNIMYHLYADDIIIYFSSLKMSKENIQHKIGSILSDINNYMLIKHLKLNKDKTEILYINGKHQLNNHFNNITINDQIFHTKSSIKSIGCVIDKDFNMNDQISNIVKNCNYTLHCLSKIRNNIDIKTTKILVSSLIISKLEFNLELLYNIPQNAIEKLEKILKRSVRLIFKLKKRDCVKKYLKELQWLPITERIKFKALKMIHNCTKTKNPEYLNSLFQLNQSDSIQTRQCNGKNLKLVKPISEKHRRAASVYGPALYNSIPLDIRSSKMFNKKLKKYLFDNYFNE